LRLPASEPDGPECGNDSFLVQGLEENPALADNEEMACLESKEINDAVQASNGCPKHRD
jgi:hypothetical protein